MSKAAHWKAKPEHADYDEMRTRILDAAWEHASVEGPDKLTLNSVARRARCARSSVYRYFDSKEQLLGAALNERILAFGRELDKQLRLIDDPAEQMVQGVYLTVVAVKTSPALRLFRFLEPYDGIQLMELTLENVPQITKQMLAIDPLFQRAREDGLVREEVSDDELMKWLVMVTLSFTLAPDFGARPQTDLAYLRKMLIPSIFSR